MKSIMVEYFVEKMIKREPGSRISHKKLFQVYELFCNEMNLCPENKIVFGRTMNDLGFGASANYLGERIHRDIALKG